jgi:hypothetical protein
VTLSELGVGDDRIKEMASKVKLTNGDKLGFFVPLSVEDIEKVFELMK